MTDVLVVGATPGGVAAAVRAAREGATVTVTTRHDQVGGMLASGVSVFDTVYRRSRAPMVDAFREGVRAHYADTYGRDSSAYRGCDDGHLYEPHVAEAVLTDLLAAEAAVEVRRGYHPVSVARDGRRLESVRFAAVDGGDELWVRADAFVDATYEGDIAAVAGVPYRLGREPREAFDEQHAGRIFTRIESDEAGYPRAAVRGDLAVEPFGAVSKQIISGSTGAGDDRVQTYLSRLCLTDDPDNRRLPEQPAGYDRERYAAVCAEDPDATAPLKGRVLDEDPELWDAGVPHAYPLPNRKRDWNAANFVGESHDYPEADLETRDAIAERHHRHAVGFLYFLQHDDAVPEAVRERAREWGLARDEYADTDNRPHQVYVREARRIEGRATFTENDARVARGLDRAPVREDAVAITEWPMDCHDVVPERRDGSANEGDFFLTEVTRPGQIPYRAMLPVSLDDLLVPVALSASHVGFQTVRLEPTWLQTGEAAGAAAAMAVERETTPAALPTGALLWRLVERGSTLTFFNDVGVDDDAAWTRAVQYLGTVGLFPGYEVRPGERLSAETAAAWARAVAEFAAGVGTSTDRARAVRAAESSSTGEGVTPTAFDERLRTAFARRDLEWPAGVAADSPGDADRPLGRGEACQHVLAGLGGSSSVENSYKPVRHWDG